MHLAPDLDWADRIIKSLAATTDGWGMAITTSASRRRDARCTDDRFDRLRRPCPECGQLGARIVYGYPSRALAGAARQGQVVLGGCTHRGVTHQCPTGHRWAEPGVDAG